MKLREHAEKHILHIIGDGRNTKLWLEKWHPEGILIKIFGESIRYDVGSDRMSIVASIIQNGEWHLGPRASHCFMQVKGLVASSREATAE